MASDGIGVVLKMYHGFVLHRVGRDRQRSTAWGADENMFWTFLLEKNVTTMNVHRFSIHEVKKYVCYTLAVFGAASIASAQ